MLRAEWLLKRTSASNAPAVLTRTALGLQSLQPPRLLDKPRLTPGSSISPHVLTRSLKQSHTYAAIVIHLYTDANACWQVYLTNNGRISMAGVTSKVHVSARLMTEPLLGKRYNQAKTQTLHC
eukprot:g54175.t1